ncbi:hypothetical protein P9139_18010 [Curtobacterium flaccumfaciens]|nr:hypothetical protein P9139_18010 [Curtobacterium flaccumfaciens]
MSIRSVEGRTLLWAHADNRDDVLAEIGLTMQDLFDEEKGVDYRYQGGRIVHRSPAKRFFQSGNKEDRSLYRAERITADVTNVWMAEGEQDVHALESLGVVAVCTAMGAGKAARFDLSPLHGRKVFIVRDMDEPGLNHARQVRHLLAGKAHVTILEPIEGKDAADHITAGHALEEFRVAPLDPVEPEKDEAPTPPAANAAMEAAVADELWRLEVKDEVHRRRSNVGAAILNPKYLDEILTIVDSQDWLIRTCSNGETG